MPGTLQDRIRDLEIQVQMLLDALIMTMGMDLPTRSAMNATASAPPALRVVR